MTTKTKPAVAAAEVTKLMTEAAATSTAQAQKLMAESTAQAKAAMEKTMEHAQKTTADFLKAAEEAMEFGRGNIEAMTRAMQVYFTGMQDLGRQMVSTFQGLSDHALEGAKALSAAKSLKEVADLQVSFARTALEKGMADMTRLQEAVMKVAEDSFAPISARVTAAMERMARPVGG
ncbi:MAG: phasin family protein [Rhodovarius sp.]|nr:phasin family protein [Rhodovarius sp.]MCX7932485.1 phasin family protein [Rhodovarius sp.]MDW8315499.1 phasin family protein [Rhodovarius sp.]